VALVSLLLRLGFWQLDRAQQKLQQQQLVNQRQENLWLDLPQEQVTHAINQQRVQLNGRLLHQTTWLLDNKVYQGQVGYEVLVPLLIENSNRLVIVNLGWVKASLDRNILPPLQEWTRVQTFSGLLHVASANPYRLSAPATQDWPKRIGDIDLVMMEQQLGFELSNGVYGAILRLDPTINIGYQKQWRWGNNMTVAKHQGYAFQWFALALTLALLTLYFSMRLHKEA